MVAWRFSGQIRMNAYNRPDFVQAFLQDFMVQYGHPFVEGLAWTAPALLLQEGWARIRCEPQRQLANLGNDLHFKVLCLPVAIRMRISTF